MYGPEIKITGLMVQGKSISLVRPSANFVDIALAFEGKSCPYLLSFEPTRQRWLAHGKVLHRAPSLDQEYTEIKSFAGFRSRFRLEEREPEAALIDQAELVVLLKDDTSLALQSLAPRLKERDGNYIELYWGEATEFAFELPDGVDPEEVVGGLQRKDVLNYKNNLIKYNRKFGDSWDVSIPTTLELLNYIAGNEPWPEDFTILAGSSQIIEDWQCGEGSFGILTTIYAHFSLMLLLLKTRLKNPL